MSNEVRGDSMIQIQKGKIKTHILEQDYEAGGYKEAGWIPVSKDWTKERKVKAKANASEHMAVAKMAEGAYKKKK